MVPFDSLTDLNSFIFLYRTFLQSCSISQLFLSQAGGMSYSVMMNRSQLLESMRFVPVNISVPDRI